MKVIIINGIEYKYEAVFVTKAIVTGKQSIVTGKQVGRLGSTVARLKLKGLS